MYDLNDEIYGQLTTSVERHWARSDSTVDGTVVHGATTSYCMWRS